MGAAIWSAPAGAILNFPALSFARFFANHGLLQMTDRPQWRTVRGGSREYVSRLLAQFRGEAIKGDGVTEVTRGSNGVTVATRGGRVDHFDRCLIACHADEALDLLADASARERELLGAFSYASNDTFLHSDASLMPVRRRAWASWNYLGGSGTDEGSGASVSYWMNKLQPLQSATNYFISLNPGHAIDPAKIYARFNYQHPLFDRAALVAQKALWSLQGARNTWFAGSYFGFGFHEDALQSGLAAAEDLAGIDGRQTVRRPWQVAGQSDRLTFCPRAGRPADNPVTAEVVAR